MSKWLGQLDRLLGGDGTIASKKTREAAGGDDSPAARPIDTASSHKTDTGASSEPLHVGARELVDHLAPAAMKIQADRIQLVGEGWIRIWFIEDLPPRMGRGSLDTIYDFPGEVRISLLTRPLDKSAVREHLRQRRTTLYAENLTRSQQGRLPDFTAQDELHETESALRDIESSHLPPQELLWTIALYGRTEEELEELSRRLEDYMLDADLRFFRASLRQEDGLYSVQPFGVNYLGHGRNITTSALAGMFPFARRLQADTQGIPYGIDRTTGAWVIVNDFALPNSNLLIVGEQGSGKSMFLKYKATWAVLLGMRCYILDLEGEFEPMCRALDGTYLDLSLTSPHHMNVLDLNPEDPDAWFNGMQDALAWLEIALGTLTHKERNVILIPTYERIMKESGIQPNDPGTWKKQPPVLSDLYAALRNGDERREAQDLADRLQTLAEGVYAGAFSQHTNVNPRSPLVVFGLKNVHPDMQALRMRQVHTFIWANVLSKTQPTLVVVDEAWRWLEHPGASHDLAEMARRFRKRNAGVHLATQHGGDLSASQDAVVIRDTAALTVLFRQTAASIPSVSGLFGLNEVEARELVTLDRGESVLLIGGNHIPLFTVIPPAWYPLWTTDPRDRQTMEQGAGHS
ncbi:MAG: hypothetical protein M1570_09435 [Chloroflexi bacterium]|nr:hypothetical protein [Chloroflexota bacterium]